MAFSLKRTSESPAAPAEKAGGKPKKPGKIKPGKKGGKKAFLVKPSPKRQCFALFVGDDGAILVFIEGATVSRRLFAPTAAPEHTSTMKELMQQHPKAPIHVFMDVLDQQYVRQTFPPVSPLSVGGLVERRIKRDFPAEDLTGSIRLGREATARKDWVYLLIDLANTANYQQWFDLVIEQPNRLMGINLVPLEAEHFIAAVAQAIPEKPPEQSPWQMLISHNKVSGFRIVVLRNGKLTFTRVGQAVGESVAAVLAGNVEQEIQNTIEYIRRLGYNDSAGLEVYAVLSAEVRDAIDTRNINASTLNLLSPYDVAELLQLKQAALAADRFGDVVMATAMALAKRKTLLLKPKYAQKLDMLRNARLGIYGVAGLVALLMVGMSVSSVLKVFSTRKEISRLESTLNQSGPTIAVLKQQVSQLGVDVNTKSDVVAFFEHTKPVEHSPIEVIAEVAKLRRNNVVIDSWEWKDTSAIEGGSVDQQGEGAPADGVKYPIMIEAKADMLGEFPDNQTVLEAVTNYKLYISGAIKKYRVEIPNVSEGASKISVAIQSGKDNTEKNPAPALNITLSGPIPDETPAAGAQQ